MVKLQNPNPHLQRGDSRTLQVKTPVTGLRPTKCHKCSFAAPGFPVVSFCLEVKVFDRSGKKNHRNSLSECFFGESFLQEKEFLSLCCPVVYRAIAHTISGLIEKNKIFHSFLPLTAGKEIRDLSRSR